MHKIPPGGGGLQPAQGLIWCIAWNKANLSNLYHWLRVILEKLINHKTLIPLPPPLSSPWVSFRSKLKAYQLLSVLSSIKINLSVQFQYITSTLPQRSGVWVRPKFCFYVSLYFFQQHDHIQIFLPFNHTHSFRVCVRTKYVLAWCSMLHFL